MVVEANRDAARQCVEKARAHLQRGERADAQRWMHKAKKLDPECNLSSLLQHDEDGERGGGGKEEETTAGQRRPPQQNGWGSPPPNSSTATGRGAAAEKEEEADERSYAHDDHYDDGLRHRRQPHGGKERDSSRGRTDKPSNSTSSSSFHNASSTSASHSTRQNAPRASRSKSGSRNMPPQQEQYSKEEMESVERIRHCKDYYEILQIERTSFSDSQLKKRYYALALKLHPDKCKAPGATEAFKAVGNAYAVLSDTKKREDYDRYGAEADRHPAARRRGSNSDFYEYDVGRGFEAEMSPEDIFEMFFGGGGFSRRGGGGYHRTHYSFTRRTPTADGQRDDSSLFMQLLQILPILVILFGGLLVQFFMGEPAYSLQREGNYVHQRYTHDLRVPYYVKSDFEANYGKRLRQVEQHVEDDYLAMLRTNCYREKNQRDHLLWTARLRGDGDLWRKAQDMELVYCKRLEEIYR